MLEEDDAFDEIIGHMKVAPETYDSTPSLNDDRQALKVKTLQSSKSVFEPSSSKKAKITLTNKVHSLLVVNLPQSDLKR